MSNELALLWEQVVYLTQKFYGKSFEKVHFDPNQINLFSEEFVPQEDGDLPSWRNRSHHISSEEGERKAPRGTCSFDGGIFNWCRKQTVLQGSKLGRSIITYALNYEETFKTVLEDGRLVYLFYGYMSKCRKKTRCPCLFWREVNMIELKQVSKSFGERELFSNLSMTFEALCLNWFKW